MGAIAPIDFEEGSFLPIEFLLVLQHYPHFKGELANDFGK